MMNPRDIKDASSKFEKATFGYKQEMVDEFLKKVADSYADALRTSQENEAKIIKLVEKINEYREDEEAIKQTLLTAQKSANQIVANAKAEAEKLINDAKIEHAQLIEKNNLETERIINENNERCEKLIKETADRTEQKLAAIKLQHENAKDNLDKMKIEVTKFKAQLVEMYNKQLELIADLPELTEEEIQAAIKEKTARLNAAKAPVIKEIPVEQPAVEPVVKEAVASKEELGFSDTYKNEFGNLKFGKNN
ncbi:MAG: DivIVA domain-containing protein [Oscillospiraceae bacterium]|nr:DivIVA domain-containing protein [Oscillospiraceae bacterium]MBQ8884706.1 DivIVA domain-containing protein [Oscillospiraceae bacterium]